MQAIRDIGLLLARVGFGWAMLPHGWEKGVTKGYRATAQGFQQAGIPFPEVSAWVAIAGELGSGVLLILGFLTPLAGVVAAVAMYGAVITAPHHLYVGGIAHPEKGVGNLLNTGWGGSSALVLGSLALALAVTGPGRLSLDNSFFGRFDWLSGKKSVTVEPATDIVSTIE